MSRMDSGSSEGESEAPCFFPGEDNMHPFANLTLCPAQGHALRGGLGQQGAHAFEVFRCVHARAGP